MFPKIWFIQKRGSASTATIKLRVEEDNEAIVRGQTGKIVPKEFIEGKTKWVEIGKARIHSKEKNIATAEFLSKAGQKADLVSALKLLKVGDYLEIDNYGISSSLTSALAELEFSEIAKSKGYSVKRMPEDIAKHLMEDGKYYNYDFLIEKDGVSKKIEVKSLWGTDTSKVRLIHALGKNYKTSSCKFETQDIFAVNLFLRTGRIKDFAYAISKCKGDDPHGLPCATCGNGDKLIEYVHQNPDMVIGNGKWYGDLDEIWEIRNESENKKVIGATSLAKNCKIEQFFKATFEK